MEASQFITEKGKPFVETFLKPWLALQSISADPSKKGEIVQAADMLVEALHTSGFFTQKISLPGEANDVVYAEKMVDIQKPTVLIYGHYDVQPINQPDKWILDGEAIDPFGGIVKGDRIYNRGATDDKGQVAAHILAQQYFSENPLPCNVKFLIEGNEEYGDEAFTEFVEKNAELLACDVVLISDTGTLREGYPCLESGLKGIVALEVTAASPLELVKAIAATHDPIKNKILIPHFYDAVQAVEMPASVEEEFGEVTEEMGMFIRPEEGWSQLAHRSYRPTNSPLHLAYVGKPSEEGKAVRIIVHGPKKTLHSGLYGGPVQEPGLHLCHFLSRLPLTAIDYISYGSSNLSTAICVSAEAQIVCENVEEKVKEICVELNLPFEMVTFEPVEERAAYLETEKLQTPKSYLSFRLVAEMDDKKIAQVVTDFVSSRGCQAKLLHSAIAYRTPLDDPYVRAVIKGLQQGYDISGEVHISASGGSIPIAVTLAQTTGRPVALAGFSTPTDGLHGPLESFRIEGGLFVGAKSIIAALEEIGKLKKR